MCVDSLHDALIAAHSDNDQHQLVSLYQQAYQQMRKNGHIEASFFYLTNAYVFALDCGHGDADDIAAILKQENRL